VNREVCVHGAPTSQRCDRCSAINPKSLAGILLREHDTPRQAFEYANRKAKLLASMHNAVGLDYQQAAQQIARHYELAGFTLAA
jgi:hypothetical protein